MNKNSIIGEPEDADIAEAPPMDSTSARPTKKAEPTTAPPPALAAHPSAVTPPFVPAVTSRRGSVIKRGLDFDKTPSSLAQVSPPQHA